MIPETILGKLKEVLGVLVVCGVLWRALLLLVSPVQFLWGGFIVRVLEVSIQKV